MSSWYDKTGVVPASSPESESDLPQLDSPNATGLTLDETELRQTPPKKSILRPSGFLTPRSDRKSVTFARKSLSLNLTPACSPAYRDRKSIAREDMANFTFCLEKSDRESPRARTPLALGVSRILGQQSPRPGNSQESNLSPTFDLSKYMEMLRISAPLRKSFSTASLNKIGVQSTPIRVPSRCASPDVGLHRRKRNFFGTPEPHQT